MTAQTYLYFIVPLFSLFLFFLIALWVSIVYCYMQKKCSPEMWYILRIPLLASLTPVLAISYVWHTGSLAATGSLVYASLYTVGLVILSILIFSIFLLIKRAFSYHLLILFTKAQCLSVGMCGALLLTFFTLNTIFLKNFLGLA